MYVLMECCVGSTPAAAENLPKDPSGPLTEWLATVFYPALASHPQLVILPPPQTKLWRVYVDLIILSAGPQSGLLYDSVTLAARAALWDLKIPKTRGVAFQSKSKPTSTQQQAGGQPTGGGMDVDQTEMLGMKGLLRSGRAGTKAAAGSEVDFELESYWDEGAPLKNREHLPVAITLHLVRVLISRPPLRSLILVADCAAAVWQKRVSGCDHSRILSRAEPRRSRLQRAREHGGASARLRDGDRIQQSQRPSRRMCALVFTAWSPC